SGMSSEIFAQNRRNSLSFLQLLAMACLVVLPMIAADVYTKYGDHIKEQSPFTAWLSSSHPYTLAFRFGTLFERLSLAGWSTIFQRIQGTVAPCFSIILALGFCLLPWRTRGVENAPQMKFWIGGALSLAPLVVMLVFFKLYVIHTYYIIACAPFL